MASMTLNLHSKPPTAMDIVIDDCLLSGKGQGDAFTILPSSFQTSAIDLPRCLPCPFAPPHPTVTRQPCASHVPLVYLGAKPMNVVINFMVICRTPCLSSSRGDVRPRINRQHRLVVSRKPVMSYHNVLVGISDGSDVRTWTPIGFIDVDLQSNALDFVRSFARPRVRRPVCSPAGSPVCSFVRSPVRPFARPLVRSSARSSIRSSERPLVRLSAHPLVRWSA